MSHPEEDLGPWHLAVNKTVEAMDAVTDVAILTGNHAPQPRAALRLLQTVMLVMAECRERERLARNAIARDQ